MKKRQRKVISGEFSVGLRKLHFFFSVNFLIFQLKASEILVANRKRGISESLGFNLFVLVGLTHTFLPNNLVSIINTTTLKKKPSSQ